MQNTQTTRKTLILVAVEGTTEEIANVAESMLAQTDGVKVLSINWTPDLDVISDGLGMGPDEIATAIDLSEFAG